MTRYLFHLFSSALRRHIVTQILAVAVMAVLSARAWARVLARFIVTRACHPSLIAWDLLRTVVVLVWFVLAVLVWSLLAIRRTFWRAAACTWLVLRWTAQPRHALALLLLLSMFSSSTPAAPRTVVSVATEWQSGFASWVRAHGDYQPREP